MNPNESLFAELAAARAECERLKEENERLQKEVGVRHASKADCIQNDTAVTNQSSAEDKIQLFRRLFRGREDVYPVRWENRHGKTGCSPACIRRWGFPENVSAGNKDNREFLPLTDQVFFDHLAGKQTIGVYPLLADETCWFLAADFDKTKWREDVSAFRDTCVEWNIPAALERSRSGTGGHVWIFFEAPVSAALARKLGSAILTQTMERRHQIGLDSYDRFFPNQDTMPKGGFGNLIALPLQQGARAQNNSIFLNENLEPYPDQWAFLSSIQRMTESQVEDIVRTAERSGKIIGVRLSLCDEDSEIDPWTLPPSKRRKDDLITEPLPHTVSIVRSNLVYVEKNGVPSAMLNRLMRLAAFQNPEFYKTQAMRLSTFGKPRIIRCASEFTNHIGLPRGCLNEATALFQAHKVEVQIKDERFEGNPIEVQFHGELHSLQMQAANAVLTHDEGVLSATTAFGKRW